MPSAAPKNAPATTGARRRRRRLTDADYQALGDFRFALRKFLAFSAARSEALGLTPQQHQALLAIRAHVGEEPMTVGKLAESLLIKNHSALGLVDRLVDRGLVVREVSSLDRRRVVLSLTDDAAAKLEIISRQNFGELNAAFDIFHELLGTLRQLDEGLWQDPPPRP